MHNGSKAFTALLYGLSLRNLAHNWNVLIVCGFIELVEHPSLSVWTFLKHKQINRHKQLLYNYFCHTRKLKLLVQVYLPPHFYVQHAIKKTKKGTEALRVSRAHRKILGLLLYILLLNILNSALSASISATVNLRRQVLQDYLQCEARGRQAECSATELINALQTSKNLVIAFIFVGALYPTILLPFIVNVKELKKSCKRICSSLKTSCVSNG